MRTFCPLCGREKEEETIQPCVCNRVDRLKKEIRVIEEMYDNGLITVNELFSKIAMAAISI